jgi:hypothetical protein
MIKSVVGVLQLSPEVLVVSVDVSTRRSCIALKASFEYSSEIE